MDGVQGSLIEVEEGPMVGVQESLIEVEEGPKVGVQGSLIGVEQGQWLEYRVLRLELRGVGLELLG